MTGWSMPACGVSPAWAPPWPEPSPGPTTGWWTPGCEARPGSAPGRRRCSTGSRRSRVDGVVDGLAHLTGRAGREGRRLQSGQTHQYYAGIAVGLALLVVVLVVWS